MVHAQAPVLARAAVRVAKQAPILADGVLVDESEKLEALVDIAL